MDAFDDVLFPLALGRDARRAALRRGATRVVATLMFVALGIAAVSPLGIANAGRLPYDDSGRPRESALPNTSASAFTASIALPKRCAG